VQVNFADHAIEAAHSDPRHHGDASHHAATPLPVLVITSNRTFAQRLQRGLHRSTGVTLSVRPPPRAVTSVVQLMVAAGARVIVVDSGLFESGLILPAVPTAGSEEASPEVLLAFDSVGERAVHLSLLSHAHGCIEFDISAEAFAHAVDTVANGGEFWFPRWMVEPFFDMALAAAEPSSARSALGAQPGDADSDLTEREIEVMRLVRHGLTNKEVGKQLGISPNTVKKHVHNVLHKHGILRRRQLFR
jgi:DNA-binding NarL/FixJ family response regulator